MRQLSWLIARAGSKEALVRDCGNRVGLRTLDTWSRGDYPRSAVTGAVRELDAWALTQDFGYPDAAGAPRLVATCGPGRNSPAIEEPTERPAAPASPSRIGRRWVVLGFAQLAVIATTVGITVAVVDDGTDSPTVDRTLLGVLPSQGDGTLHPQTVGDAPVVTFGDPRGLTAGGSAIPAGETVQVRCTTFVVAADASVSDGWWYLVDSGVWSGLWAAAPAFRAPGNTVDDGRDPAVPECTSVLTRTAGSRQFTGETT